MLNRHNFAIAELAPSDEEMLHLCGILVTPEGTSATDGHQAIFVSGSEQLQGSLFEDAEDVSPADFFTPFILDRESALKIAKAIPKKSENPEAHYAVIDATTENNERAMVSINDVFRQEILRARKIVGKFPDVLKIMPEKDSAKFVLRMNPELLLDVLKAVKRFCDGHETGSIELRLFGAGCPLRIDAVGIGQSLTAVVMPQRSDAETEAQTAA